MSVGVLFQVHSSAKIASVEAIGSVEKLLLLKERAEKQVHNMKATQNYGFPIPDGLNVISPDYHLLITDDRVANKIKKTFAPHIMKTEIWELVQNFSLVEKM